MANAIEAALHDLLRAARIEPICGPRQLAEKRQAFLNIVRDCEVGAALALKVDEGLAHAMYAGKLAIQIDGRRT